MRISNAPIVSNSAVISVAINFSLEQSTAQLNFSESLHFGFSPYRGSGR